MSAQRKPAQATLRRLRALPGVAEAFQREGRLWLRFTLNATTEERDTVAELLTGHRPRLRRFEILEPGRARAAPEPPAKRGGRAA